MKKTRNIFAVSMIALMAAGAAHANLASTKYVDDGLDTKLDTREFGSLADKNTISNADVAAGAAIATSKIDGLDTALAGKQDSLNTNQMAAVNSGANTTNIGQIATNTTNIAKKADAATGLTGATKTKITYNGQGIVTGGADLTASDIPTLTTGKISGLDDALSAKEVTANRVTSLSGTLTDANYPTAKAVNTAITNATSGLATAASVTEAKTAAGNAQKAADAAQGTADGVKAVVENTTTGLAATKKIADDAAAAAANAQSTADGKLGEISVTTSGSGVVKSVVLNESKDGVTVTRATVAAGDIANNAVTTAKILNANVTAPKLADGVVKGAGTVTVARGTDGVYTVTGAEYDDSGLTSRIDAAEKNIGKLNTDFQDTVNTVGTINTKVETHDTDIANLQKDVATRATKDELTTGLAAKQDKSTAVKYSGKAIGDGKHALTVAADGTITASTTELATKADLTTVDTKAGNAQTAADNAKSAADAAQATANEAKTAAATAQSTADAKQDKIKAGTNITIAADGVTISATGYTLPTASKTEKGGIKVDGTTITVSNEVASVGSVPVAKVSGLGALATKDSVAYAEVTGTPTLGALASKSTITDADVATNAKIATSKIDGLDAALAGKQGTLKAGDNINIATDGTISATDTKYTAGTGVAISTSNVVSAKLYSSIGTQTDGALTPSAVNGLKTTVDGHTTDIAGLKSADTTLQGNIDKKQDKLTDAQLNAVNSGITSAKVTTYDGYQAKIDSKADSTTVTTLSDKVDANTANIATNTADIATNKTNIAKKVDANTAITANTTGAVKIKYDAKGLVTGSGTLAVTDIPDGVVITGTNTTVTHTANSGVYKVNVADGTTKAKGVVQLSDSTAADSSTVAATTTAVRSVVGKIPQGKGSGTWVDIWVE